MIATGQQDPDGGPHDHAAVDREAALPHRDDLLGKSPVIIPVEDDLVDPRAHQPRHHRPLPGAEDRIHRQALFDRAPLREPESDQDRGGHEDAVPADGERAQVERDGAGRGEHEQHDTTAPAAACAAAAP